MASCRWRPTIDNDPYGPEITIGEIPPNIAPEAVDRLKRPLPHIIVPFR
jgi:hypothetical protein